MNELPDRMVDLLAQIRAGQISVQQALMAQIGQGRVLNQSYACVVDELATAIPESGTLAGVALAHKDIFNLHDRLPGCGVQHGSQKVGVQPAAAIELLANAGASQWAALVMAPHACGATAQNPHFIHCVNPLDDAAAVGGSSSGSAVAVASGMTYASLGTDTAGSVRIPAASCGLIGLKTTHGAVSTLGCSPLAPSLDSVGILSRCPQDAREIWQILSPNSLRKPTDSEAICRVWFPNRDLDSQVVDAIRAWIAKLDMQVTEVDITDEFEQLNRHAQRVLFYETARTHRVALLAGQADPAVQAIGLSGLGVPEAWYQQSIQARAAFLEQFVTHHFNDSAFLILPSLGCLLPDRAAIEIGSPAFDRSQLAGMYAFMGFVNYLGVPALNLPISRDALGRPICVQVLARPFAEHCLLDFAEHVEPISQVI